MATIHHPSHSYLGDQRRYLLEVPTYQHNFALPTSTEATLAPQARHAVNGTTLEGRTSKFILPASATSRLPPPPGKSPTPNLSHVTTTSTAEISKQPLCTNFRSLSNEKDKTKNSSLAFTCQTCNKIFHAFEVLVHHMFYTHVTDRPLPRHSIITKKRVSPYPRVASTMKQSQSTCCEFCSIPMASEQDRRHHLKKKHNIRTYMYHM